MNEINNYLINELGNLFLEYLNNYSEPEPNYIKYNKSIINIIKELISKYDNWEYIVNLKEFLLYLYFNFIKFFPNDYYQIKFIKDIKLVYPLKENISSNIVEKLKYEVINGKLDNFINYISSNKDIFNSQNNYEEYLKLLNFYQGLLDNDDNIEISKIIESIKMQKIKITFDEIKEKEINNIINITLGNINEINKYNGINSFICYFLYSEYDNLDFGFLRNVNLGKDEHIIDEIFERYYKNEKEICYLKNEVNPILSIIFIKFYLYKKDFDDSYINFYSEAFKTGLENILTSDITQNVDFKIVTTFYNELKHDLIEEEQHDKLLEITLHILKNIKNPNLILFEDLDNFISENTKNNIDTVYSNLFDKCNFENRLRILEKIKNKQIIKKLCVVFLNDISKNNDEDDLNNKLCLIENLIKANSILLLIYRFICLKYYQVTNKPKESDKIIILIKESYNPTSISYYPSLIIKFFYSINYKPSNYDFEDFIKNVLNDYLFNNENMDDLYKRKLLKYIEFLD